MLPMRKLFEFGQIQKIGLTGKLVNDDNSLVKNRMAGYVPYKPKGLVKSLANKQTENRPLSSMRLSSDTSSSIRSGIGRGLRKFNE